MEQKSASVSKVHDPRSVRTLADIDAAFVSLLSKRSYSDIRVSDIVRKARVGRATYYAHYTSKDDLLRAQVRRIVVPMLRDSPGAPWLFDCTPLFSHVRNAGRIYRSLLTGRSRLVCERIVQDALEERVAARLVHSGLPSDPILAGIAARLVAASLMTMLSWWTEHGAELSLTGMQDIYQSFVGSALKELVTG